MMSDFEVVTDNTEEVRNGIKNAITRALETIGLAAEGYAKRLCPVDTGLLRNSITHAHAGEPAAISMYTDDPGIQHGTYSGTADGSREENVVYIGTNVEYAEAVELGKGQKAQPFLRPAANDHAAQYSEILRNELENG